MSLTDGVFLPLCRQETSTSTSQWGKQVNLQLHMPHPTTLPHTTEAHFHWELLEKTVFVVLFYFFSLSVIVSTCLEAFSPKNTRTSMFLKKHLTRAINIGSGFGALCLVSLVIWWHFFQIMLFLLRSLLGLEPRVMQAAQPALTLQTATTTESRCRHPHHTHTHTQIRSSQISLSLSVMQNSCFCSGSDCCV